MKKPLGKRIYGSIPHLSNSKKGPADKNINIGQEKIATLKTRDNLDNVIVQEKLDGSNVGAALLNDKIIAMTRRGYLADTSPFEMHHIFDNWVKENEERFRSVLIEGERICGEWMIDAHGTKYNLPHEPFVAFDIFNSKNKRILYYDFLSKINIKFVTPHLLSTGRSFSVDDALEKLGDFGFHGATEKQEGAVWRVERNGVVEFLCKYVRPDKENGKYIKSDERIRNTWF